MRNRYYPKTLKESWEGWKPRFKQKLEELDYLSRQVFKDVQHAGISNDDIRDFLQQKFAELWNQVAEEQENQTKYRREGA